MCRHLAYLGDPVPIRRLVVDPPLGLYRQSWAPRQQRYGTVNVDGFGVGWYADGDPVPARYRRAGPIWADPDFADLARVVRTGALLAAVRSATEGCAAGPAAAAPFGADRWLFSHNGVLPGWPLQLGPLASLLPPAELLSLEARSDSALVWALTLHRLRDGASLGEALAGTVRDVTAHGDARLNLLLTDGTSVAATTWGDTLHYRTLPGRGVVVASEPSEDATSGAANSGCTPSDDSDRSGAVGPDWIQLPDRSLLLATADSVTVQNLREDASL